MPTLESYHGYYLWHYIPSRPAAIAFTILFAIATAMHSWKMFKTRLWFCLPFVIGGFFEIIGYIGRALAYDNTASLIDYILQSIFLLLAPILFAASLYMTFGRLVRALKGDRFSFIPPRWITRVFVFCDCFSFLIQGSGAGILVRTGKDANPELGEHIIIGGLIFQVVMFGLYIVAGVHFHIRYALYGPVEQFRDIPWQSTLYMLYVTSAAVMARNIFRVVQYATGQEGYLQDNEWPTYVFDGALMLLTMVWFYFRYPSKLRQLKMDHGIEMGSSEGEYIVQPRPTKAL